MGSCQFFVNFGRGVLKGLTVVDKEREEVKNYLKFVDVINGRPLNIFL